MRAKASTRGDLELLDARPFGGAYVLDQKWSRLGIASVLTYAARGRRLDAEAVEQVLFCLVVNRCLEPSSKLAACSWAAERLAISSCPSVDDDACYRAMDFLLDALGNIAEGILNPPGPDLMEALSL